MGTLTIYGSAKTRALRPIWVAEELGLAYEHVPYANTDPALKSADYLAITPMGSVPAITDGDFKLWESMAISIYLARKGGTVLIPAGAEAEAKLLQWTFWSMTEAEKAIVTILYHRMLYPEADRVPAEAARAEQAALRCAGVANNALASQPYFMGDAFTLADLNVASVFIFNAYVQLDFSPFPNLTGWMDRCLGRPAAQRMMARP